MRGKGGEPGRIGLCVCVAYASMRHTVPHGATDSWKNTREHKGKEVSCSNTKDDKVVWKVIKECNEDIFRDIQEREIKMIVIKNFNLLIFEEYMSTNTEAETSSKSEFISIKNIEYYTDVFWKLWPQGMEDYRENLNKKIREINQDCDPG